jgi:tripartite-type tricarboxylate transporter receptor subunit TctC
MKLRKLSLFCAAAFAATSAFTTAQAQGKQSDVANFYKGKTVQLMVGYSPGGGYDTYARTLARHLGNHIPGNPTVVVKNVPGAGSLVLTNQLAQALPKDGTVIGTIARGMAFEPLFGNEQARFKPADLNWLGSLNDEVSTCVARKDSGIENVQDLKKKTLTVGGTGAGADTDTFPKVLDEVLGLNFNVIPGYPGGNDVLMAIERGEVQGRCGWSWSSAKSNKPEWFAEGGKVTKESPVNLLLQMSLNKHPDLPDVPLVMDLAETEKQKQVLKLLFSRQTMGRPYVAPPGVPEARLTALRRAMEATAKDPAFLEDAKKQNLEITFVNGEEIQEIVKEAQDYPKDVIDVIKRSQN